MNVQELAEILRNEGFRESAYSLHATFVQPDEALCLRNEDGAWQVFYSERGLKTGKIDFSSEAEACMHLLAQMRADPTTKQGWRSGFSLK
jgi:hypothetical protein